MKILILYPWKSFWAMGERSGAASFHFAVHGYVDHGHEVHVVLPGEPQRTAGEQSPGLHLHRFALRHDPMEETGGGVAGLVARARAYLHFRRRVLETAEGVAGRTGPDVVLALGPHPAPAARILARKLDVPNVTRLFGQALILHLHPDGRLRDPLRFYAAFPEVLAFRTPCRALIVHDDGSRGDLVARRLGVPPERLYFWRDGVDLSLRRDRDLSPRFKAELGFDPARTLAASIGRLSPEKNLDRVLEALSSVRRDVPGLDIVFVGDGPSRGHLEAAAGRLDLGPRTRFLGAVPREEIPRVLGASDLVLSVSDRTNMTNSVIEAMAAEVPPIALNTGATSSVVANEETGLLVDPFERGGIGRALLRLARDGGLRRRLGRGARSLVEREFESVESRVKKEVDLVTSLARGGEGGGATHGARGGSGSREGAG
jgi:glycosyltransferase involved in cell wall biosynthesis